MQVDLRPLTNFMVWLGTPARKVARLLSRAIPFWLFGVACIAALIWWGGPLLAIADTRPLESEFSRMVFIGTLIGLYLIYRIIKAYRARSTNKGLFESLVVKGQADAAAQSGAAGEQKGGPTAQEQSAIRERFTSAVDILKSARFGEQPSFFGRLTGIGSRKYMYQLPWYIFVGAPGSGKTTALLNSGLKFPLADKLGQDPLRGVAGTRHCDWWFTDHAVMIDTAGRYTTQDSDQQSDAREWTEFLALLKRYRPRQPINGVLVTISAADLMMLTPADRERQASAVRARLQELSNILNHVFPVYVLVTKADLIAGFTEFFEPYDREQREQIWGFTLPFDPAAAVPGNAVVSKEFDALFERLTDLALDRLHQERDLNKRALIYGFPYQLQALRTALLEFYEQGFGASRLTKPLLVRGVYFTSGTQEGNPIDRVIGAISRSFGLQRQMLAPLRPSGKAFFLKQTLHDVVFPEAVLAGTNLQWEKRFRRIKWGVAITSVLLASVFLAGQTISFFNNRSYVIEVAAKTDKLKKILAESNEERREVKTLLPVYAAVLDLPRTANVNPVKATVWQGFGLFQGEKLNEASQQSYHRMLRDTLAPLLSQRIEQVLRTGGANPDLQYETLKTYVMVHNADRMKTDEVKGWVAFDLEVAQAAVLTAEERAAVLEHVDALLSRNVLQGTIGFDEKLATEVRQALLRAPFPQRIYDRLKRNGVGPDINDFRIPAAGGPTAALVFTRVSGKSLNEGVPAFFTYDGYHNGFAKALEASIKQLAEEETWVLGLKDSENARRARDAKGREELMNDVKRLYLQEYGNVWEKFIADITIVRGANLAQTIQTARMLTASDSPLTRLLRAIVREVTLAERPGISASAVADKAQELVKDTKQNLIRMLGARDTQRPAVGGPAVNAPIEVIVDDRFAQLRALVRAPAAGQPAPIEQTLSLVNDLYAHMNATETAVRAGGAAPPSDLPNRVKNDAGRLPEPMKSMLTTLASSGASQAMGVTKVNLSQAMKAAVTDFCVKAIGGRYPFTRDSSRDVTPEDFASLFATGGRIEEFFKTNLAQYVDQAAKPWRFRQVGDAPLGEGSSALVQFQRAAEIRSVFFSGASRGPSMRLEFKPLEMDPAILSVSLDIDGQVIKYAHGPTVPQQVQWPGPRGTNQIRLQVTPPAAGGASGMVFDGPWAPFRMFDRTTIEPTNLPEKFRATFNVDGKKIQFEVTTASVQNPFRLPELRSFSCPGSL